MKFSENVLKNDERALFALRDLYQCYGYSRFKVSKFEEYDLYARNKNFLVSENILTFTDTNGKLMALKPDVTLSIVKNIGAEDGATHKLYYNENVYRTSGGRDGFGEIMQAGLECIGDIGIYDTGEVLTLAQKSLALISEDYILDLSHMGFVTGLLENAGIDAEGTEVLLDLIANKNLPAIKAYCKQYAVDAEVTDAVCAITSLYEPIDAALKQIAHIVRGDKMQDAYNQLIAVAAQMRAHGSLERVYLDFSIVNDMSYYNGIIFRGFINGIPDGVLSGGRYDSLLQKMGKRGGAIGFAVYLDLLERLNVKTEKFDVDALVLCDEDTDKNALALWAEDMRRNGKSVLVQSRLPDDVTYRQLLRFGKGGVEALETND